MLLQEEEEEEEKKKNKMENMAKMWKALFEILRISYITDQPILVYWLFFRHS